MMPEFAARIDRLRSEIRGEGLDALLVTNPLNVTYLTGFSGEATYLVLSQAKVLLISDGRFAVQLLDECPGIDAYIRPTGQLLADAAAHVLGQFGATRVGFESGHLTVADFETLRGKTRPIDWKPGAGRVEAFRAMKDDGEIDEIRQAIGIAEAAYKKLTLEMKPDHTEKNLHDAMESLVRDFGGKHTAFPTIVAVGDHAALPHAPPTGRRLGDAPFVLIDWGASGPFYKSDLTRVLWTDKSNTNPGLRDRFLKIAEVVRNAQLAAIERMRPGAVLQEIDAAARKVIADAGYEKFFNHGLGHGFGLQIHEAPFMRPTNTGTLAAGMVVTVEPGIYLPGDIGVRIEDDVLITPDGPQVLTSVSRDPTPQ